MPAQAVVSMAVDENISKTDLQSAQNITNALNAGKALKPIIADSAFTSAAEKAAEKNTVSLGEGRNALMEKLDPTTKQLEAARIVLRHYLDVKLTDVDGSNSFTLDITPMQQTLVTFAQDNQSMRTKGRNANTVEMGEPVKMPVTDTMPMTLPLPAGYAGEAKQLFVQHLDYVYTAQVITTDGNDYLTFENPHGFSAFTVVRNNNAEVQIDNIGYILMETAVSQVKSGQTITLLRPVGKHIPVDREMSFTLAGEKFTGTFAPADGLTCTENNRVYSIGKARPEAQNDTPADVPTWIEPEKQHSELGWLLAIAAGALVVAGICTAVVLTRKRRKLAQPEEMPEETIEE